MVKNRTGKSGSSSNRISEFRNTVTSLKKRGFEYLGPVMVTEISSESTSESMLSVENCLGGEAIQGSFGVFSAGQSNPNYVPEGVGTSGLGYIPWGPNNSLPNVISRLVSSLPYTSAAIKYIIDLTVGLGPQLMYRWAYYSNGSLRTQLVPFRDAGVLIRGRIMELMRLYPEEAKDVHQSALVSPVQIPGLSVMAPETESDGLESLGTVSDEIRRLKEDYKSWKSTLGEWETFCRNNNLGLHFLECMTDDAHMDIYFPTIGLSIGRRGEAWNPKIVKIGRIPAVCTRMEEMDNRLRVNYVYYSEKWRQDVTPKLQSRNVVAYPVLMPQNMLPELKRQVERNRNKSPRNRPTWFCCPSFYPDMLHPYYPQPAWWSIFTSRTYDYASTLITDKATARQNATMWGKMIFINNEYLRSLCDDMEADTPEERKKIRDEIYGRVNNFLRRRENNGKTICLDSVVGPDGKTMQNAVEIVDVPQPSSGKDIKSELEEISSIIFFAIGVHPALIGSVPGRSGSSGGTYQRELQLLKQNQVSPRQRIYLRFLQSVYDFNGWDSHGEIVIRQQVLTTLDRNATGVEEVQSTQ